MDKSTDDQSEKPSTTLPGVVQKIIKSPTQASQKRRRSRSREPTIFIARSALTMP